MQIGQKWRANGAVEVTQEHGDEEGVLGCGHSDEGTRSDGVPEAVECIKDNIEERERGVARRVSVLCSACRLDTNSDRMRCGPQQNVCDHA